jgi:hypothetical protein
VTIGELQTTTLELQGLVGSFAKLRERALGNDDRPVDLSEQVEEALTSTDEIYRLACHLLAQHRLVTGPLRLIGIGLSTLVPPERRQLVLGI